MVKNSIIGFIVITLVSIFITLILHFLNIFYSHSIIIFLYISLFVQFYSIYVCIILLKKTNHYLSVLPVMFAYLVLIILLYSLIYNESGLLLDDKIVYGFEYSVYFSGVTFTTLGYGDIQASVNARAYAVIEAINGYLFLGCFSAVAFAAITGQKVKKSQ
jgi:hypothetical protein